MGIFLSYSLSWIHLLQGGAFKDAQEPGQTPPRLAVPYQWTLAMVQGVTARLRHIGISSVALASNQRGRKFLQVKCFTKRRHIYQCLRFFRKLGEKMT